MPEIRWIEAETAQTARWHSENGTPPPRRVVVVDDRLRADAACRLARSGTAMLWRGDFHNARQLLAAMGRRVDRTAPLPGGLAPADAFRLHRRHRGRRARVLGMLLVSLADDYSLSLRRAPRAVAQACLEAYGPGGGPMVVSLRELLGVLGAHQWRRRGVEVPALGERIHPHYGVFAPSRGEYVDLVAQAPLPWAGGQAGSARRTAFDLGTGTGVLAAVLAGRGAERVVATDISPRAVACARANLDRLGLAPRVEVVRADLFPPGRAALVVCNPPWVPARPTSTVEQGVYDPDGRMLHGFLSGLADHLEPGGEGWLVMSDLAEHLGLRSRQDLLAAFRAAGLRVVGRTETRPRHPAVPEPGDLLWAARSAEVVALWRLAVA